MIDNQIHKLVLGTVQFGLNYGINNQAGQTNPQEVETILACAQQSGIQYLDTSYAYGESESVLGQSMQNKPFSFKIITKYPQCQHSVRETFNESLRRIGAQSVYGYLVHHFDFYLDHPEIWDEFLHLKAENVVSKIGFSIYNTEQLQLLLDRDVDFDLIQFPFNILDRQFEPYFPLLKEKGVEIHTRSVFLQGLFFKEPQTIQGSIAPLRANIEQIRAHCERYDRTIESLALNYAASQSAINGILIGVDSSEQLRSNLLALSGAFDTFDMDFIQSIDVKEPALLNPVNWK